ncbi:uracil-xanthine permease family protein [Xanthobacter aminoxidans]|uniref:uracil-xanthine permease family protein n=1 Tax=Xanthobacter aminoxidans TaxID=186280 RepID=UPI002022C15E|nr:xanthine permease [Xanthobacter aminoxidans]
MGTGRLRYDHESHPPFAVLVGSVAQHMGLMAVTLVFPLLVAQAAGVDAEMQRRYIDLAMLAMGVATLFQCWGRPVLFLPRIGCGYLLPAVFTAAYLPAALYAARAGGLGAVAGMTIAAGLAQVLFSRVMHRVRPFLPIEIVGLVVMLIGIILGVVAIKLMVGYSPSMAQVTLTGTGGALAGLAVMVALAAWGSPPLRAMAVLAGLAAGTLVHVGLGFGLGAPRPPVAVAPLLEPIRWPLAVPSFSVGLLPGFLAGALACILRSFGDMVASQRANDPNWRRPDYANIEAGVMADGLGTLFAGLIGTMGLNTYSASVGLSVATEVKARRVGLGVGLGWIALAFIPGSSVVVMAIPRPVLGAALLFASAFIVLSGISILGQRMLDARRTIVVGLGFLVGISFDEIPDFYARALSASAQELLTSSLVLGLFTALGLNALFRIGAVKSRHLVWTPAAGHAVLRQFLMDSAAADGARTEEVGRIAQIAEEFATAAPSLVEGPVEVTTRFDEFVLDVAFAWTGGALQPGPVPSFDAGVDEDAMLNGITFHLIQRLADRTHRRTLPDGRQELRCEVDQ